MGRSILVMGNLPQQHSLFLDDFLCFRSNRPIVGGFSFGNEKNMLK